jgi:CRISPR/Cas system-associated protein endoribonuclease Cas2
MIKVKSFKKLKSGKKKYEITFEKNGKTYVRKFGAAGMSDFTVHKDRERRERYISRHKKDLRTGDPMKPGYLSMYILWNKPSLKASLADYKRRLNVYNRTGKFPTGISGSKKLSFGATDPCSSEALRNLPEDIQQIIKQQCAASIIQGVGKKKTPFGTIIPFEETSLRKLPTDIQNLIQRDVSSSDIQRIQRGRNVRKIPANMMTKKFLKQFLWRMNAEYETPEYATEQMTSDDGEPWLILNPGATETAQWLYYAADILTAKDFDNDDLWYLCLEHVVDEFVYLDPDINVYQGQVAANITVSQDNVEVLLGKIGHYVDYDEPRWYNRALAWFKEEYATGNSFGKKGGSKIPDNVVNKKLYASIKAKIKRSIKGRRWGAYDSGRLVREYKAAGGGYTGKRGKTDLGRWYKEKWVDACAWPKRKPCGRKTKEKIAYCRPSKRIDSKTPKLVQQLTKTQIKSRCAKKKKSPMKRVTKFGATQEIVDKMRQQMYNQIMASSDVSRGIENTISKRCKRGFQDSFCQSIFTDLLLSIYYTIVKNSVLTDNRKQNISEMEKFIPNNFKPTLLKINKSQFSKIDEMLYSLQDHTYGTFKNARVASLIYEYIHVK